jgi:hypothetical protein
LNEENKRELKTLVHLQSGDENAAELSRHLKQLNFDVFETVII